MRTNLKLLLWRSRIHQNKVAQEMKIDEAVLSRIVNGYLEPSPELRRKIAKYLGADEDWLFSEDLEIGPRESMPE